MHDSRTGIDKIGTVASGSAALLRLLVARIWMLST
jgi:hypothetical protein